MNFKTISTILTFLSLDLLALSSPINDKKYSTDAVDVFKTHVDSSQTFSKVDYFPDEAEVTELSSEEETMEVGNIEEILEIDSSDEDDNVCNTSDCIEVSNNILNDMDTSVDPCEDFYQFTCGNFLKNNLSNANFVRNFDSSAKTIKESLIKIMEGDFQLNKNVSEKEQEYNENVYNKLKGFYKSCKYNYNNNGSKPLFDLFNQLKINENKDRYNDPNELAIILAKLDHIKLVISYYTPYNPLFTMNIILNETFQLDFSLSKATPILAYGSKDEIKEIFSKIYNGSEERDIDKMVDILFEFENKLFIDDIENTNIIDEEQITSTQSSETVSLKTLNEKYSNINWKLFLEEKFKSVDANDVITDEIQINITNVKYIENLNNILSEVDGEVLSYYFEFYIINYYLKFLPDTLRPDSYKSDSEEERTEFCYNYVENLMDYALAKFFYENNFPSNKREYAEKVIEYIKQSMMNRIPKMEWLDDETIEYAYKKVAAMTEVIGSDDYYLNSEFLFEQYKSLEFDENDFFTNMIKYFGYANNNILDLYVNIWDHLSEIGFAPYEINAAYIPRRNKMNIPAGILQPPLFNSGIPDYINYGGIGAIIGHEFTHAFDNTGKNYDMNGNLSNWWTANDNEEYEDLTKCFIDQYNKFGMEDLEGNMHYTDGTATLGENLSDNGGVARAYDSWKLSLMEDPETVKKENQQLPGLTQYTPEQLFFISYGHIWCESFPRNKSIFDYLSRVDPVHSRSYARVNGVAMNNKEFAKAFNCPVNSKMNPEKKCEIW